MVHIDEPKSQPYIKFKDIRRTEDVLKLTKEQVEYRSNKGEISIVSNKAEWMGMRQVPITYWLSEVSYGVLQTVLLRYGEGMEFQAEKMSRIYSYPVENGTGIAMITLTKHTPSRNIVDGHRVQLTTTRPTSTSASSILEHVAT